MTGCFRVYPNPTEEFDIKFEVNDNITEIPSNQERLYVEVECACNTIKALHSTETYIKQKYFNKLLSLARVGLVGVDGNVQVSLANKSLEKLKEEIILIEGYRIKNEYMRSLGKKVLLITILLLTLYILIYKMIYGTSTCIYLSMYFTTFICSLVGTWISFGARNLSISFEQLGMLEKDMMDQWIRLIYIGICSIIILTFLNTDIMKINIGSISSDNIKESFEIQSVIGLISGLVESRIGFNIYNKVKDVLV